MTGDTAGGICRGTSTIFNGASVVVGVGGVIGLEGGVLASGAPTMLLMQ